MNKYPSINDSAFQQKVKEWIDSEGEIYINVGFWRAGGANVHIVCNSFNLFIDILYPLKDKKGAVTVLRHPLFKVQGIVDGDLLKQAMSIFPDGKDWFLICPDHQSPYNTIGSGDRTHKDMEALFQRLKGRFVVMGEDEDFPPDEDRNDVLVARFNL